MFGVIPLKKIFKTLLSNNIIFDEKTMKTQSDLTLCGNNFSDSNSMNNYSKKN